MLIITNRNLSKGFASSGIGDEKAFGEQINADGPNEVRLANAEKINGKWVVELVKEPNKLTSDNLPSRVQFEEVLRRCKDNGRNCLFFVHGYNKPFKETLEQGWKLQERYNLEVVLFSWPSNTGGFPIEEYKNVKRVARSSTGALDSSFEKLAKYVQMPFNKDALMSCSVSLNLMTYSMGNFMLQSYVEGSTYDGETRMFSNVILCQADCDNEKHERWVDNIQVGKRVYVTINENDKILGWSDANFQKDRLGRTARNLVSKSAIYFDFTESEGMGNTHQIWGEDTNNVVKEFFKLALNGGRAETTPGLFYDARVNAFKIEAKIS